MEPIEQIFRSTLRALEETMHLFLSWCRQNDIDNQRQWAMETQAREDEIRRQIVTHAKKSDGPDEGMGMAAKIVPIRPETPAAAISLPVEEHRFFEHKRYEIKQEPKIGISI